MHAEDGEILALSQAFSTISGYSHQDIPNFDIWLEKAYGANAPSVAVFVRGLFNGNDDSDEHEAVITTKSGEHALGPSRRRLPPCSKTGASTS